MRGTPLVFRNGPTRINPIGFCAPHVWSPGDSLEGVSPDLWLRADQRVYTGGARQFYATDNGLLQAADAAALDIGTSDLTVSLWVRLDSVSGYQGILSKGGNGARGYSVLMNGGVPILADYQSASTSRISVIGSSLSTATWYHIIVEYDRDSNLTLYVNNSVSGTPASIAAGAGDNLDTSDTLLLGGLAGGTYLNGRIANAGIWKRTLTAAEKTWLSGSNRVYGELGVASTDGSELLTSLSAYWNLNETSGTANAIDQHSTNDLVPTFVGTQTNGTFGSDANWTKGTGWMIAAGVASSDGSQAADSDLEQASGVLTAHIYSVTYTVSGYSAGTVSVVVGGTTGTARSANGTYVETITVSSTNSTIAIRANAEFVGNVDDFAVVALEIPAADGPANSTGVVDGDPAVSITSVEGNAYDFTAPLANQRPLYRSSAINSKPGLEFDSIDDLLSVANGAVLTGTAFTTVIVWKQKEIPNTYQTLLASSDTALATKYFALHARGNTANPHIGYEQRNADTADLLDGDTEVTDELDCAGYWSGSGTTISARLNGTAQTLAADGGANNGDGPGNADTPDKDNTTLGGLKHTSETNFAGVILCELLHYPVELTIGSRNILAAYLLSRYGLTL